MSADFALVEGISLAVSQHLANQVITSFAVGESNVCQASQLLWNVSANGASVASTSRMSLVLGWKLMGSRVSAMAQGQAFNDHIDDSCRTSQRQTLVRRELNKSIGAVC